MDLLWTFLFLVIILFVGSVVYQEAFVTGTDASGSTITMTLSELMSLFGKTSTDSLPVQGAAQMQPVQAVQVQPQEVLNSQFYTSLKDSIVHDVRQSIEDTLTQGGLMAGVGPAKFDSRATTEDAGVLTDSCIDSVSSQQGADFLRYVPGKNPADYIRKDSIPCYGCSLP